MRSIPDTIARLSALKARQPTAPSGVKSSHLLPLEAFGSNPGSLKAYSFIPEPLPAGAPLVVVLHGCTQTTAAYDHGSGWSKLAARDGFAVLFAEQQRSNNANLCFNWFVPADTRRDSGEVHSIRQMIEAIVSAHELDRKRIFVTGLSAGGAMAGAMLATYPEIFAGGAIIAGLPHGAATTMPEAFDRMRGAGLPDAKALQDKLASASPHKGPWPVMSIWHGTADTTVAPANADAIVAQWRKVHGAKAAPSISDTLDGQKRRVWRDSSGRDVIESITISGMGHGTPIDAKMDEPFGTPGPFMLHAGISSTEHIARFWGLIASQETKPIRQHRTLNDNQGALALDGEIILPGDSEAGKQAKPTATSQQSAPAAASEKITKVIEDALRAAGLMR